MKRIGRYFTYIPRSVRVLLDIIIAAVLLSASYIALKMPIMSDEARFRMIEKRNLVGPSEIIAELDIPFSNYAFMSVGYDKLIIGDDGDSVIFVSFLSGQDRTSSMDGRLIWRDKKDGILLAPLPSDTPLTPTALIPNAGNSVIFVPFYLIVDDTDAAGAVVTIRLSDEYSVSYSGLRLDPSQTEYTRGALFLINGWVEYPEMHETEEAQLICDLIQTNSTYFRSDSSFPTEIKLYDAEENIIESRSYVIQSQRNDAHISR